MKIGRARRNRGRLALTPGLTLVSTKAILTEGCLGRLAPLLRLGRATAVAARAAWLLHGLVSHLGVTHLRVTKGLLLLSKGLSTGAGSCPRIRLFASILQLPPVPLT